jgi:hypothetical protein
MRSLMSDLMEWLYALWRAAWQRQAGEFYGELEYDPDAGREGLRHGS